MLRMGQVLNIGIKLQQLVRRPGEALHTFRDDIYENVATVCGDSTVGEQERISVAILLTL